MILTHGANSIERGITSVEIGGRRYPVVKIGTLQWIGENLDFQYMGGVLGTDFFYYNNGDAATYGLDGTYKCGLLYTGNACKHIIDNDLVPGWHVPSIEELHDLMENAYNMIGFKNIASKAESWSPTWTGRDYFGFNLKPGGNYNEGIGYINLGQGIRIHTSNYSGQDNIRLYLQMNTNTVQYTGYEPSSSFSYIRLVKNY